MDPNPSFLALKSAFKSRSFSKIFLCMYFKQKLANKLR